MGQRRRFRPIGRAVSRAGSWPIPLRLATRCADLWIGRRRHPDAVALSAVAGKRPVVLVTGGSTGIGLALARRFAQAGHAVALVGRDEGRLTEAATGIAREFGVPAVPLAQDIQAAGAPASLAQRLAQDGAYIDVLVNSAGIGLSGAFAVDDVDKLDALIATNIAALTRLTRHVLPGMLARGRGGILSLSSLGAYTPGPYQAAYYASKSYVLALSEAIAHETSGRGVRVCAVAPGPVNTRFHAEMQAEGTPYRLLLPPMSPQAVARSAYRGFCLGRRVVVPGPIAPLLMLGARALPHPLLVPITGLLLRRPGGPAQPPAADDATAPRP